MSTRVVSLLACISLLSACAAGDGGRDAGGGDTGTGTTCVMDSDCTDDGVFCNGPMVCTAGFCTQGMPPSCEDGVACTADSCSAMTDECQNVPDDMLCPATTVCQLGMGCVTPSACEFDTDCGGDGMFCNGDEVCVDSVCTSPEMRGCDDEDSCTIDECSEGADMCSNTAADNLTDVMHCGATGANDCVVCATPTAEQVNMTARCDSGTCALDCDDGFFDSDDNPANGCECASGSAEDEPDVDYLDTNCDGIDGDRSRGILVAAMAGNDTATCGLELDRPCRTIAHAMTRAITESRRDLFLMAGSYEEIVTLRDGIRIFGGYDTSWVRGPRSDSDHRTEITGDFSASEGQYVTIIAHDLLVAPTLENLVIVGPDAAMDGLSSYAVHVENTDGLVLLRSAIVQGHGAAGAAGDLGVSAGSVNATPGMQGGTGGNAGADFFECDSGTRGAGGLAGSNSCAGGPSAASPLAGAGGAGGVMDNTCICLGLCFCDGSDCDATGGVTGGSATHVMSGGFGFRGAGGGTCTAGTGAIGGQVRNGAAGLGATAGNGSIVDSYWVGTAGGTGGTGENGGGGGGGGGSGGCDDGFIIGDNSWGAGGGGGGAGGCAAFGGGGGGGGGGGSFGVFAVSSTVTASNCEFARGNAGAGGTGGVGGRGQTGGPAGTGGTASSSSTETGGNGGAGAHGGHGGGGGGGAGGLSYGVFSIDSTVDSSSSSFTGGSEGVAGTGGPSAPTAPAGERDGNDGLVGVAGARGEVFECAAAGAC